MLQNTPHICSLSTAAPPNELIQTTVAESVTDIFSSRFSDFKKLKQVFVNCGIEKRNGARPLDWYFEPHGWPDRTAVYLEAATELFIEAARKAMDEAGVTGADIGTVVTISSTGIATPGLEARAAKELGFPANVSRVPVFGLGCAGGVTGLALAGRLAKAEPDKHVLLVVVELCTLAVRLDQFTKGNIVALALFGDGAAAAVIKSGRDGLASIEDAAEHSWPDTLDIMGWSVDPEGFGVIFDRSIPAFAKAEIAPALKQICEAYGVDQREIGRFICHPGGTKVIEALESALMLQSGTLDHERAVLAEYGNMSAPTALFVLRRAIEAGLPERSIIMALGPGFTLSTAMLGRPYS
ncbi:MAG: type III polyketide synthase [Rhodomicrobiaceae bacterium]